MEELKRELYLQRIRPYYDVTLIKVLTGIRSSGKSTILQQIIKELLESKELDHIIEVNLESIAFIKIGNFIHLNNYIEERIIDNNKYYLFIDEIQVINKFEKVLASLVATKNISIFITGSNSKLLYGELASLLTGRTIEFNILPFTYKESIDYMELNHSPIPQDYLLTNYLIFGGLPQRFIFDKDEQRKEYGLSIYQSILKKDIITKSRLDDVNITFILTYLMSNASLSISSTSIVNYINRTKNNYVLLRQTVDRYLHLLEKYNLISKPKRYDILKNKVLIGNTKVYLRDSLFKYSLSNNIEYHYDLTLENIIYNELLSRSYTVYIGVLKNAEIGFIVCDGNKRCYIRVCYFLYDDEVLQRAFNSFNKVRDGYPRLVLSLDKIDMSHNGVVSLNIEEFLLGRHKIYFS